MLTWKLEGDNIWGYAEAGNPFTAYVVQDNWAGGGDYLAWSHRGETPKLLGTFGGPQEAMAACEKDHKEKTI